MLRLINISSVCFSLEILHRVEHYNCIIHILVEFRCYDFVTIFRILIRFFFHHPQFNGRDACKNVLTFECFIKKCMHFVKLLLNYFVAIVEKNLLVNNK